MIKEIIRKSVAKVTDLPLEEIKVDAPELSEHGDYSTNVAMRLASKRQSARVVANEIVKKLQKDSKLCKHVSKIEVAGGGFINFYLKKDVLINNLIQIGGIKDKYGKVDSLKGKKILLEHTSPNTIKTLHVAHIRNNVLGISIHNILEFAGADVKLDAINNDRGIHVMKAFWEYINCGKNKTPESVGEKPDHFVDKFYVMGAKAYEDDKDKKKIQDLLRKWEEGDNKVRTVWKKLRDWTLKGFEQTYSRLGSFHDQQWFESDFYKKGKEIVQQGLKGGIFRKLEDGAVLTNLSRYGLTDTIVIRSDGTSMYITQDLYLTKLKREKFPSDKYIWDIGPEQTLYLKQMFAVCEQLGIGKIGDYFHLSYGLINVKGGGKMSSRAGNIISADELMDSVVKKAGQIIEKSKTSRGFSAAQKSELSEIVGIGAIKYGFLKVGRITDLYFDIDKSLALDGDSGPYLQYTVARANSVLQRAKFSNINFQISNELKENLKNHKLNDEELSVLRTLVHFSEVVERAEGEYAPNFICEYLFDLAQKYNTFYNKHRIINQKSKFKNKNQNLKSKNGRVEKSLSVEQFRLLLTFALAQVLKNGLGLLGIQAPERM
jgi:arginyl-tRNA synthetase